MKVKIIIMTQVIGVSMYFLLFPFVYFVGRAELHVSGLVVRLKQKNEWEKFEKKK